MFSPQELLFNQFHKMDWPGSWDDECGSTFMWGHFIVEASWVLRPVDPPPCVPLPLDLTLPCYCWHCQGLSLPCHPLLYSTALHHTVDSARCTVNSEQWTVDSVLWTVNSAQCTVNSVRREVISFIWGLAVQTVLSFSSVATTVWCSTLDYTTVQ